MRVEFDWLKIFDITPKFTGSYAGVAFSFPFCLWAVLRIRPRFFGRAGSMSPYFWRLLLIVRIMVKNYWMFADTVPDHTRTVLKSKIVIFLFIATC